MAESYFLKQLHELDISDMWFQHDGATSHIEGVTIKLLKSQFGERVILISSIGCRDRAI